MLWGCTVVLILDVMGEEDGVSVFSGDGFLEGGRFGYVLGRVVRVNSHEI